MIPLKDPIWNFVQLAEISDEDMVIVDERPPSEMEKCAWMLQY